MVNFSGASSTGKSTMCDCCANLYGEPGAMERMRDVMIRRGINIADITNDVFIEAYNLQQVDIHKKLTEANKYLFTDSGPLIFYLGNKYSFGREYPILKQMAIDFYKTQDVVFLCDNHISFDSSIMRGDEGTKDILQGEIIKFLHEYSIKYVLLCGNIEERAETVRKHLANINVRTVNQYADSLSHQSRIYNATINQREY